jgi:hypothetical protein
MDENPLNQGVLTDHSVGIGPVTREMVRARAREIALMAGRAPPHVSQADHDQAKRELTGGADMDRQDAALESIPESERADPVPDSTGRQTPESASEDEDDEGRSETEQLVGEGVEEAERDQRLQAAQAAEKIDRRDEP